MGNHFRSVFPFRPRLPFLLGVVLTELSLVAAAGCSASHGAGAPPRTAARTPPRPPSGASRPGLRARSWGKITSLRFALEIKLPERRAWQVDDHTTHWLLLRHPPSDSELRVRTWRAGRLVHPDDCERRARLWRPEIPTASADTVLDRRKLASPAGYTTRAVVGVRPLGHAGELEGYVLAFGAKVGGCFAFVYTTRARGAGAEAEIGDRLALVSNEVLPSVYMRTIDDRAH